VALQSCYDDALRTNAKLTGTVTIRFVVEKRTGTVTSASVDSAGPTPSVLGECVLQAVNGLKLEPPDRNDGQATFVYEFRPTVT
jgi:TonB family protein